MFSAKVTKSRLDSIANTLPFTLRTYSIEQCRAYVDHFKDLLDDDSKIEFEPGSGIRLSRQLTPQERQFIRNERIICGESFLYAATRYFWIRSTLNTINESVMLFAPNNAQRIYLDVCATREEQGLFILLQILKARQLGSSAITDLIIAWKVLYRTFVNALIGSSDPDKTKKMAVYLKFCWENMPFYLKPADMKVKESGELMCEVKSLNNFVTLQHGTQFSGIARGDNPTDFHLSEIPDFADPEEDIGASLENAVHEDRNTFGVLESTAKGTEGFWPGLWKRSIAGISRYTPMFFGWYLGSDIYPTPNWLLGNPIPADWQPSAETQKHVEKCERYAASDPLYVKHLGKDWQVPRRQQWWYERMKLNAVEADKTEPGSLSKFIEEMPATPDEAFQLSGSGVFRIEFIQELRDSAWSVACWPRDKRDPTKYPAIFGITGPGVPIDYHPDPRSVDLTRPHLVVKSDLQYGEAIRTYELLPLKPQSAFTDDGMGKLYIYEWYNPAYEYGMGGDCAEGLGRDRTAFEVERKGFPGLYQSVQAAEFAHDRISANEAVGICDAILALYTAFSDSERKEPRINIEMEKGGSGLQHSLKLLGWGNHHIWEGAMDWQKRRVQNNPRIGWVTNLKTRPWMINELRADILSAFLKVNSPWLINELATLHKAYTTERIEAEGEHKDDRVLSFAMIHFSLHIHEIRDAMLKGVSLLPPTFSQLGQGHMAAGPNLLPTLEDGMDEEEIRPRMEHPALIYI